MAKLFNGISVCGGVLGGLLAYFLGGWDVLLKTIVFLAVADYVTGLIKAVYLKQLSSEVGYKGLLKKILMFIIIAVAFEIQKFLNHAVALREIVITFYVCNEGISLLENKTAEQQDNSYSTMMMYEVKDLVDDLIRIVRGGGVDA